MLPAPTLLVKKMSTSLEKWFVKNRPKWAQELWTLKISQVFLFKIDPLSESSKTQESFCLLFLGTYIVITLNLILVLILIGTSGYMSYDDGIFHSIFAYYFVKFPNQNFAHSVCTSTTYSYLAVMHLTHLVLSSEPLLPLDDSSLDIRRVHRLTIVYLGYVKTIYRIQEHGLLWSFCL